MSLICGDSCVGCRRLAFSAALAAAAAAASLHSCHFLTSSSLKYWLSILIAECEPSWETQRWQRNPTLREIDREWVQMQLNAYPTKIMIGFNEESKG